MEPVKFYASGNDMSDLASLALAALSAQSRAPENPVEALEDMGVPVSCESEGHGTFETHDVESLPVTAAISDATPVLWFDAGAGTTSKGQLDTGEGQTLGQSVKGFFQGLWGGMKSVASGPRRSLSREFSPEF